MATVRLKVKEPAAETPENTATFRPGSQAAARADIRQMAKRIREKRRAREDAVDEDEDEDEDDEDDNDSGCGFCCLILFVLFLFWIFGAFN